MAWYDPRDWSKEQILLGAATGGIAAPLFYGKTKKDSDVGATAKGGLTGAATGFMLGGPVGAAAGAGAGLGIGYMAGREQRKAQEASQRTMGDAQGQLAQAQGQAYQRRMADLNQAMQFYKPAAGEMKRLYGMDMPFPTFGGGAAGGPPPGSHDRMPNIMSAANKAIESRNALGSGIGKAPTIPGMGAPLRRVR